MTNAISSFRRVQHFYVAAAKHLFYHPDYGIVSAGDAIRIQEAARYNLSPLLLYGLTLAGLPVRWLSFSPFSEPLPLRSFLLEAWRQADGLRGLPDTLLVNRHLAASCPELADWLAGLGVTLKIAAPTDRTLTSSLRSAQIAAYRLRSEEGDNCGSAAACCAELNRVARDQHLSYYYDAASLGYSPKQQQLDDLYTMLPQRELPPDAIAVSTLDWTKGSWLYSWENSLPPERPRSFDYSDYTRRHCLVYDEDTLYPPATHDLWPYWNDEIRNDIARYLVACWPNPPLEIARAIGISVKELNWYLNKKTALDEDKQRALEKLLGIVHSGDSFICHAEVRHFCSPQAPRR
ncbi:MAG: hypothetical protein QM296_05535 [Bacillota bacterium]|nr:hypothetical protein [Bacillota bacterium]